MKQWIYTNDVIAELWVIRHIPTGKFLPIPTYNSRRGRGGSSVEPVSPSVAQPRTFDSEKGAKSALGHWLRGRVDCTRDWAGNEDCKLVPMPHRKRDEMEIIPVVLMIKETPDVTQEEG